MKFTRNNKPALFDKYRGILVPETPEERVRQHVAERLERHHSVPSAQISTEYPLSRWDKRSRRRADIIVWATKDTQEQPLLVLEAKAPHIPLTDDVHEQAIDYLETLGCNFYGITNGEEYKWYLKQNEQFRMLTELPTYEELLETTSLSFAETPVPIQRLPLSTTHDACHIEALIGHGIIGEDTPEQYHKFISELDNFCLTEQISETLPITQKYIKIVQDLGMSYRSYGNAAGGSWAGTYRSFLIEDGTGNHQIYRLAIMGKGKFVNDRTFGNSNANKVLIIAVDDFEKSHNSLQLNLDKSIYFNDEECHIIHDGKITVGKKGSRSPKELIEFMNLVPTSLDGKMRGISLGSLPKSAALTWPSGRDFILNLLNYAYLRDAFRRSLQ